MDQRENDEGRMHEVPQQMSERFGAAPQQDLQELPSSNKTVPLIIIGVIGLFVLAIITLAVVIMVVTSGGEEAQTTEQVNIVEEHNDPKPVLEISTDELKREVMDRVTKAGWGYTWKEARKTETFEAWDLVLTRKNKRIGMTVYVSDDPNELQTIAGETEAPDLPVRFKGSLLVFAPMPGKKMSNQVLEAFKEE